jgi:hypothetical protein
MVISNTCGRDGHHLGGNEGLKLPFDGVESVATVQDLLSPCDPPHVGCAVVAACVDFICGSGEIIEPVAFWYFCVTTSTTIGYGDLSPKTPCGRLFKTLWIMPGSIMLFTSSIAKFAQFIAVRWRKRMRG